MDHQKPWPEATFRVHARFMAGLTHCEPAGRYSAPRKDNSMKKLIISLVALSAVTTMATAASARPWHHHWHHHHWYHHHHR